MNKRLHRAASIPALLAALAVAGPLLAQAPRPALAPAAATPRLQAASLGGAVRIDGRLDDPAWAAADSSDAFTQSYPHPGAAPTRRTVVRVLYGADALYVGLRMYDPRPDSIAGQLARRDATGIYSDWVHVMVDTYHDRRTAFRFSLNPRGVQKDVYESNDVNEDLNWDAVWQSATRVDSLGWTAEIRVPYSQLRFGGAAPAGGRVWGFQVMRDVARTGERDSWAPWTRNSAGFVSRFGDLAGLDGVKAPRRLEVLPYLSSRLTRAPAVAGDPFHGPSDIQASAGADLKAGLPGGLTLTATVNPDFGQVEVDPAVVNLSAYETFFPEKRPFFVEGSDVFSFGQVRAANTQLGFQRFFYSRRIGRAPQEGVTAADAAWVDAPSSSTILGAAKVSGRTGAWTLGAMDALTAREDARFQAADGTRGTQPVEPMTNYFVGRLRRDFGAGATVLGAMATATSRAAGDPAFATLRSGAYFAGIDGEHAWGNRSWYLSGYLAGSRVEGSPDALRLTQLGSARYYQRPDAGYLHVDPARTSLQGYVGELALERTGAWFGSVDYKVASPGFELNDLGYLDRADFRSVAAGAGYQQQKAGARLRDWSVQATANDGWNFGGDNIQQSYGLYGIADLASFWSVNGGVTFSPAVLSDRFTWGGPLARLPGGYNASLAIGTDSRRPLVGGVQLGYARDGGGTTTRSAGLSLDLRPSSSVKLSVGPQWEADRVPAQYVSTVADPLAAATFGSRYVFAGLRQTTVSLVTRLDWTFTPTLSLQLFAQPFVAAGRYSGYKEFLQPRGYRFGVYGRDLGTIASLDDGGWRIDPDGQGAAPAFTVGAPDFNLQSLRGNAVLRWEYRPGSALFFVWQQERDGFSPDGAFRFGHDAGGLFRAPARNVFLVKATYWLGH